MLLQALVPPWHLGSLENQTGMSPDPSSPHVALTRQVQSCPPGEMGAPGPRALLEGSPLWSGWVSGVSVGEGLQGGEAHTACSGRKPRGWLSVGPH